MFGVPIEGPTKIFCDNEALVKNCYPSESMLNKKHPSIAYNRVREALAATTCRVSKEDTGTNLSDFFTKILDIVIRNKLLDLFNY